VTSEVSLVGVSEAVGAEVAGGVLRVALGGAGCCCAVDATACEAADAEAVLTAGAVADGTAAALLVAVTEADGGDAAARVER